MPTSKARVAADDRVAVVQHSKSLSARVKQKNCAVIKRLLAHELQSLVMYKYTATAVSSILQKALDMTMMLRLTIN
jgi:hypothetical protein